jgi:carboxymethylenebutenolidase
MLAEATTFPGDGGTSINAYVARPLGGGPYPGVVVIHEAFGLVEFTREIARRFAARGYIALAPDLFTRVGAPDAANLPNVMEKMRGLPDAQAAIDLEGAVSYLKGLPQSSGKVGVIGFCSGGRHTLMFACRTGNIDAAVDCWGGRMVQDEATDAQPVAPIDMIADLSCPLLGLFGEDDQNPTVEQVERLRGELSGHKKEFEIKVYPNAGHAFFADRRPSYRVEAAVDGWQQVFAWFGKHLAS